MGEGCSAGKAAGTVVVTGAGRGIGRACALALAAPGVVMALMGRDASSLGKVASLCGEKGARVLCFPFDLADVESIDGRMEQVKAACGPIGVLVSNAGLWIEAPFCDGPLDLWDEALDVNLKAPMRLARSALEGMGEGGAVVFIGSSASRRAYAGGTNYCAGKFGLLGFAGALFEDVRERGIKVCSVLPGVVDTDMHAGDPGLDPAKMIRPEDVASAVAWILSTPANVCPTEVALQPQRVPKVRI